MVQIFIYSRVSDANLGSLENLRLAVENDDHIVAAVFADDDRITGKGKNAGWHKLLANLDSANIVILGSANDLPGRKLPDLFKILEAFKDHGVSLHLHREGIDTADGADAVLELIAAYRRAKLSQAIKNGQQRALAAGKKLGRPEVPAVIRNRIRAALVDGGGIRPTARRFMVSPAYVVNVRRSMSNVDRLAA